MATNQDKTEPPSPRVRIEAFKRSGLPREDCVTFVSAWPSDNGAGFEANLRLVDEIYQEGQGYFTVDSRGNRILDLAKLINDILGAFHFATFWDTEDILIYQDGFYQENGNRFIKSDCQRRVGVSPLITEHKITEVLGHIKRSTYIDRSSFNQSRNIINVRNGLLDIGTRELTPHAAEFLSTIRIPVTYDPAADCPNIKQFLKDVHNPEDIDTILEFFGYCLLPDNKIQKAFLFVGDGNNGKSTELNLLKAFIGKENTANVSWHLLELNRFAKSALEGKLVNIFADLPTQSLNMTTAFKMLTGGDAIGAEKKFRDHYSFENYARLVFSANKPPQIYDEDSYAFWRRWVIIEFPRQFTDEDEDKNILEKLITEVELSGLLNMTIEGLGRLMTKQKYSYPKTVDETTEYYLRAADPVYAFLQDCCEAAPNDYVTKDSLYELFVAYCEANKVPVLKPNAFARQLQNQRSVRIRSTRPIINEKRVTAWDGLKTVKDVKDVKVFSPINPNVHARAGELYINKGNNPDNPDNPDGVNGGPPYPTHPCPKCGNEDWMLTPDCKGYRCDKGHIYKGDTK